MVQVHLICRHALDGHAGRWRGGSTPFFYHTHIRIHASLIRDRPETRRDSIAIHSLAALRQQSACKLALIWKLSEHTCHCFPYLILRTNILVSMRRQVSFNIHAWLGHLHHGGLGMPPRSSTNRLSTPPGKFGSYRSNLLCLPRYHGCLIGSAYQRQPRNS